MSSSSSDDSEEERIKSSVFNFSQLPRDSQRKSKEEPSAVESCDHRSVDATPEFKSYVAKKLSCYLDSVIKERRTEFCGLHQKEDNDEFRLFSSSIPSSSSLELNDQQKQRNRQKVTKRKESSSSDSEDSEKFLEAAISGDLILASAQPTITVSGDRIADRSHVRSSDESGENQVTSNPSCSLLTPIVVNGLQDKCLDHIQLKKDCLDGHLSLSTKHKKKKRKKRREVEDSSHLNFTEKGKESLSETNHSTNDEGLSNPGGVKSDAPQHCDSDMDNDTTGRGVLIDTEEQRCSSKQKKKKKKKKLFETD